jgi:hypothetical protein
VLIPKDTLKAESDYVVHVVYDSFHGFSITNQILLGGQVAMNVTNRSRYSSATRFNIRTPVSPRLEVISEPDPGRFSFRFKAVPGRVYEIQRADALTTWQTDYTTNAETATVQVSLARSAGGGREFFRVKRLD